MKARLLYLPRTVRVELDDPSLLADCGSPSSWEAFAGKATLTPCRGGALFVENPWQPPVKFERSRDALAHIGYLLGRAMQAANACSREATATGRYHLDRARKWAAVREFVAEQAPSIWPAEVAS
jgi:hypothetical protein